MPWSRAVEDTRMPRRAAAAAERGFVKLLDLRKRLAKADDDAGHAAVADDEVGTEAERHHRHVGVELA